MAEFVSALTPIMFLILLGYGLKHFQFLPPPPWPGIEKLTYYVLFPALLIRSLGNQTLDGSPWFTMLIIIILTLLGSALLLLLWYRFNRSLSPPTFTSVFQGGVRFNTYIALALALALFGSQGLAMGSVAAGFMIVLINLMCIAVFARWGTAIGKGIKPFLREIVYNPLIIGCVIGWSLSLSGIGLPGLANDTLEIIGRAALPFGLLAVGGQCTVTPDSVVILRKSHRGGTVNRSSREIFMGVLLQADVVRRLAADSHRPTCRMKTCAGTCRPRASICWSRMACIITRFPLLRGPASNASTTSITGNSATTSASVPALTVRSRWPRKTVSCAGCAAASPLRI